MKPPIRRRPLLSLLPSLLLACCAVARADDAPPKALQAPTEAAADAAAEAAADAASAPPSSTLAGELRDGFYSRINVLAFGVYSDLSDSQRFLNFLGFSRSQGEIDFR